MTTHFEFKMAIIVRSDLNMSPGKIAAQACHACLESYEKARRRRDEFWKIWRKEGAKKVILKVDSLEELIELEKKAKGLRLPYALIVDKGLTEIPPGTPTALGIGPSLSKLIDKVTGHLPLL